MSDEDIICFCTLFSRLVMFMLIIISFFAFGLVMSTMVIELIRQFGVFVDVYDEIVLKIANTKSGL